MEIEVKIEELRKKKIFVANSYVWKCVLVCIQSPLVTLRTFLSQYGMDVRFSICSMRVLSHAQETIWLMSFFSPYTHLMFIDSDVHFNPNDVLTSCLDKDIIGHLIQRSVSGRRSERC